MGSDVEYIHTWVSVLHVHAPVSLQLTCFLWSYDHELGQPVTGFLFGPDVFMSLVITWILQVQTQRVRASCNDVKQSIQRHSVHRGFGDDCMKAYYAQGSHHLQPTWTHMEDMNDSSSFVSM